MNKTTRAFLPYFACGLTALFGCSSTDTSPAQGPGTVTLSPKMEEAKKELLAVGLDKYFGKAKPAEPETLDGGTKVYK
jgi:hypothetical protein